MRDVRNVVENSFGRLERRWNNIKVGVRCKELFLDCFQW
jgi:hypothetical protein